MSDHPDGDDSLLLFDNSITRHNTPVTYFINDDYQPASLEETASPHHTYCMDDEYQPDLHEAAPLGPSFLVDDNYQPGILEETAPPGSSVIVDIGNQHDLLTETTPPGPSYPVDVGNQLDPLIKKAQSSYSVTYQCTFGSFDEAHSALSAHMGPTLARDLTIPTNPRDWQLCVARLVEAIKNIVDTNDLDEERAPPSAFKKFLDSGYTNHHIEIVCWGLADSCRQIHQADGRILGPWLSPLNKYARFPTFSSRMDAICLVLAKNKNICKHLMDPSYNDVFAEDPTGCGSRAASNKAINTRKSEHIKVGRAILGIDIKKPSKRKRLKSERALSPNQNSPEKTERAKKRRKRHYDNSKGQ
ncbi:MAG: hypothetical protein M1829_002073 [Trizodia sp. TS-e1964]|nr:MAG: hypothetical protein M1829_002073 [Trizodia sp. TS-e1964]